VRGTLVLLRRAGWDVHLATMTAGDLGTATRSRAAISRIRTKEAAASAKLLGAAYTCLGFDDLTIVYNEATKRRASALLRLVRPDLVIVPSPVDYMADHEETPRIVREAAFASTVRTGRRPCAAKGRAPARSCPPSCTRTPSTTSTTSAAACPCSTSSTSRQRGPQGGDAGPARVAALLGCATSTARTSTSSGCAAWARTAPSTSAGPRQVREGFRQHLGHGFPRETTDGVAGGAAREALPWK